MIKEIEGFEVVLTHKNIKIFNSAFCDNKKVMKNVLNDIKNNKDSCVYFKRTLKSYLREWCGHNLLYKFNIVKDRTKDVDLNFPNKWYEEIGYFILNIIYEIFYAKN